MTEPATNPCNRCGRPARVFDVLGLTVPMPFCDSCAAEAAAAEEARLRAGSLDRALRRAGATPRLLEQTLATHPSSEYRAAAERWLADYRAGGRRNLYLGGPVGVGKTGLAWGIVRELVVSAVEAFWATEEDLRGAAEPRAVAMIVRWADLLDELKASFAADRQAAAAGVLADPNEMLERAKQIPVLALDDLGRERPTAYAIEKLANLVESRYQQTDAATIVTSNYGTRELAARLGGETSLVDGERIVSRLIEDSVGYEVVGKSQRRAATA